VGFAPAAFVAVAGFFAADFPPVTFFAVAAFAAVKGFLALAPFAGGAFAAPASAGWATSAPMLSTSAALALDRLLRTCGAGAVPLCASVNVGANAMIAARMIDFCNISSFPSATLERLSWKSRPANRQIET
jgi:hypothetical protein